MCALNGTLNEVPFTGTSSPRDAATWHQCSAPAVHTNINTASYGSGAMPLYIAGWDAAGRTVQDTKTLYVDNSTPTLSLSGPTDASTTSGTQYVTARAGGSPSGIHGISCSVDGGAGVWYAGATARVPVSGVGEHVVRCGAENNAVNELGEHGASPRRSWSMKIGQPTVLGVDFLRYVGLTCRIVHEHKTIPGHWVVRHRHGTIVKTRTPPRHQRVKVTKCHPRVKRVKVVVRVPRRRHGRIVRRRGRVVYRTRIEHKKVAVQPHWKSDRKLHVRHGHATTVSGWLGTAGGTALPGRSVRLLAAPSNGLGHFETIATATTASDGAWSASVPAGPSRVIEAAYAGDPTTQGTLSSPIKEIVPASIRLIRVTPARVAWGGIVHISGKLTGGYLPAGGVNIRLRIGLGKDRITYGVEEHVKGDGRFTTSYTFGLGDARVHRRYWFQIATLPSSNYPYAPSASNRVDVSVGGHPAARRR